MSKRLDTLVEKIHNERIRSILESGSKHGKELRDVYVDSALEALAEEIANMENALAEGEDGI